MGTLERCMTLDEFENALDDLPTTLDEIYERMLRDMWKNDAKKAQNILTWLLFSNRPLTLEEVADAAVARPGDSPLSPGSRLLNPTQVLRICRSLITVSDEYSRRYNKRVATVRFAHFSIKEYLASGGSEVFTGMAIPSHEYIADCCVSMLVPIDQLKLDQLDVKGLLDKNQLLIYAAKSWAFHIRQLEGHNQLPSRLSARVYKLLDRGLGSVNFHPWMEIHDPVIVCYWHNRSLYALTDRAKSIFPPLFYSAYLGLVDATHHFIKAGSDINECVVYDGNYVGTALGNASDRGYYRVVEILLHCGADANIHRGYDRADIAPKRAVEGSYEEVVGLLLKYGADASPGLGFAVMQDNKPFVRLLLEYGADAN